MNMPSIHVMPLGSLWEIESEAGQALSYEASFTRALDNARQLALWSKVSRLVVHEEENTIVMKIPGATA